MHYSEYVSTEKQQRSRGPSAPAQVAFGTKAETLRCLEPYVTRGIILPQVWFTAKEWRKESAQVLDRIHSAPWTKNPVIVRSSAVAEDNNGTSLAGHFTSILNVVGDRELAQAISRVVESFGNGNELDQVFVQPMLSHIRVSGVIFTRDPNTGGASFVVNYDDKTADTASVTSGKTNKLKTLYHHKRARFTPEKPIDGVVALALELEELMGKDALDIEFAIGLEDEVYLLQVRPLTCIVTPLVSDEQQEAALRQIHDKVMSWCRPHPYLYGQRTVFGVMPDWNPAEIIGIRPRPLALSLYRELVTDSTWAYQRHNYGYRNLRSFPLLQDFWGLPYIDVRVSFNSFIPKVTEPKLAERLVNYYLKKLTETPSFHDKVEFEIIYSCYTLDLPKRLQTLRDHGFSQEDCQCLADDLRTLTNGIINSETGLWKKDRDKIDILDQRQKTIVESTLDTVAKIYWLNEDCKRYGTLPFAGLARAGFIAIQLLQSLVAIGVLSQEEYDCFLENLDTVSSKMSRDFYELSREGFLVQYGHLRPGTYDILSFRYDETPSRYFDWDRQASGRKSERPRFALSLPQLKRIESLLLEHGLDHNVLGLFDFIKGAIEGREYSKFVFTRSVSQMLSLFKKLGAEYEFSPDDMSYADIDCVRRMYASCTDIKSVLTDSIATGKQEYSLTKAISLPPIITSARQVWSYHMPELEPNYITQRTATGHVAFSDSPMDHFKNSILLIPSADPGFDWVFSHNIAGFITMYGGANSHMAIRAGELGIPAAIGVGEQMFNRLAANKVLDLDCVGHQVRTLQ
jgi:phosphohistidine swiveling domain-containing protein